MYCVQDLSLNNKQQFSACFTHAGSGLCKYKGLKEKKISCVISQLKIVIISEDLSPSEYRLIPAPRQNLGGHESNGDHEAGTVVTR